MRSDQSRRRFGLILVSLAAPLALGCDQVPEAVVARAEGAEASAVRRVSTVTPQRTTIQRIAREPGQIEAFETTAIHAKIAGYVDRLAVDIGDYIKQGQVLAELFVPEYEADLQQKRSLIEHARAELKQAEAAIEVADAATASAEARLVEVKASIRRTEADVARWRAEYNRIDQLVREQAVTESLRDETRSKLESAQAALEETRAIVLSAEAALAQAKAERTKARSDAFVAETHIQVAESDTLRAEALLNYAKITAPFDGVVVRRNVDTGHLTVPVGTADPLFVVARTDRVRVAVGVPERDARLVGPGDRAEVHLKAINGQTYEGTVTRISWSLDHATRTLRAEIDLENPDESLRPGLYVYASIIAEERPDVLTVPQSAIVRNDSQTYCVVINDSHAHWRPVELGLSDGKRVEVRSGLDGHEAVVPTNADSLTDGQAAEAVPADAA